MPVTVGRAGRRPASATGIDGSETEMVTAAPIRSDRVQARRVAGQPVRPRASAPAAPTSQSASACEHRGANAQPGGSAIGFGGSPGIGSLARRHPVDRQAGREQRLRVRVRRRVEHARRRS